MMYPERFSNLPAHAWPRLRALLDAHEGGGTPIHMTIGEPKHAFPAWVTDVIAENAAGFNSYPANDGTPRLRGAIAGWIKRRYAVDVDADTQVMPLNGTREGLYNAVMATCPETKNGRKPAILMPNPFYQVYMIAAISGAADPVMVPATRETGHLPDFASLPEDVLNRTTAAYICSPANPQGAVATRAYWADLIALAEKYDFKIFADECYSEIYRDTPPVGALQVAQEVGADPDRVVIFHSLSKRSNLPGLRSGFVASGANTMREIKHCGTMPVHRCRYRCKRRRLRSGTTKPMWPRTARFTSRNTRSPTVFSATSPGTKVPRPGSFCGCRWKMTKLRR